MDRRVDLTGRPTNQLIEESGYGLEIGCGQAEHRRKEYALGMDIEDYGQEIVWDVEQGIPLADNTCAKIYTSHTLEHIHPDKLIDVMNECWRVIQPGKEFWVVVPSVTHERAYTPSHLTYFSIKSFEPFYAPQGDCYTKKIKRWTLISIKLNDRGDIHCRLTAIK